MTWISQIHHINVGVRDWDRTQEWYGRVLGLEFIDRGPEANARILELYLGSGEIHFVKTPEPVIAETNHFAIEVSDWPGMLKHLEEEGIPIEGAFQNMGTVGTRDHDGSSYVYIRDPDSNLLELTYHPKGLRWARPAA